MNLLREFPELLRSKEAREAVMKVKPLNLNAISLMADIEKKIRDIELAKLLRQERLLRIQIMTVELELQRIKLSTKRKEALG